MILELLEPKERLLQIVIDKQRLVGDELIISVLNQFHQIILHRLERCDQIHQQLVRLPYSRIRIVNHFLISPLHSHL